VVFPLQEVDDWPGVRSALRTLGYDGVHLQRTGGRGDGCATLWLRRRLRLAGEGPAPHRRSAGEPVGSEAGREGSGAGQEGWGGRGGAVTEVRMCEHGLKDNVALLVHLVPLLEAVEARGARAGAGGAARGCGGARRRRDETAAEAAGRGSTAAGGSSSGGESSAGSGSRGGGGSDMSCGEEAGSRAWKRGRAGEGEPQPSRAGRSPAASSAPRSGSTGLGPASGAPAEGQGGSCGASGGGAAASRVRWRASSGRDGQRLGCCAESVRPSRPTLNHLHRAWRPRRPQGFLVANTHILFNTKRGDIKLGQLRVILDALAQAGAAPGGPRPAAPGCGASGEGAGSAGEPGGGSRPGGAPRPLPAVLVGDFNSSPGSALYRYLRAGRLALGGEDRRELSGGRRRGGWGPALGAGGRGPPRRQEAVPQGAGPWCAAT
jgi:hypothetical protein